MQNSGAPIEIAGSGPELRGIPPGNNLETLGLLTNYGFSAGVSDGRKTLDQLELRSRGVKWIC